MTMNSTIGWGADAGVKSQKGLSITFTPPSDALRVMTAESSVHMSLSAGSGHSYSNSQRCNGELRLTLKKHWIHY